MPTQLPPESFVALAAVAWADGRMSKAEAEGLLHAAKTLGLGGDDLANVEKATKEKVAVDAFDAAKLGSWVGQDGAGHDSDGPAKPWSSALESRSVPIRSQNRGEVARLGHDRRSGNPVAGKSPNCPSSSVTVNDNRDCIE